MFKQSATAVAAALLVACGGGDSQDPPASTPPATIAASVALNDLLRTSRTLSASGTGSDGRAFVLSYTAAQRGTGTLDNGATPVDLVEFTSTLRSGGTVVSTSTTTWYVRRGTNRVEAVRRSNGDCGRAASTGEPPTMAALLASGPMFSMDIYGGCNSGGFSFERETASWSVESEGSIAYICVRVAFTGVAIAGGNAQQVCVQSSAAGALGPAVRFVLTQGTSFSATLRG